jgi:hypothetical protein
MRLVFVCDQEACGDKKGMRHSAACSQKQMVFDDGLFVREDRCGGKDRDGVPGAACGAG